MARLASGAAQTDARANFLLRQFFLSSGWTIVPEVLKLLVIAPMSQKVWDFTSWPKAGRRCSGVVAKCIGTDGIAVYRVWAVSS